MNDPARILLVDDDPLILDSTRRILKGAGYEVLTATNGEQTLRAVYSHFPDLVLLDMNLPDLSGYHICRHIKNDPTLEGIFVVIISGTYTDSESQAAGLESGADGYIARPIGGRELLARVEAMLRIRRAEAATRQAERRYRELFDRAPLMYVVTHNQDGIPIITACNQTFLSALGYTRAEVIGRSLTDFYTPASQAKLLEGGGYACALQGIFVPEERELLTRSGQIITTLLTAVPDLNAHGHVVGTRAMFLDITARKQAEEQIHYQANLLANVSDAIIETDLHFCIRYWNAAAEALYGWRAEEVIGKAVGEILQSEFRDTTLEASMHRLHAQGVWRGEVSQRHRDGHSIPILSTVSLIKDRQGNAIGYIAVNRDISERKQAEEALRALSLRHEALLAAIPEIVMEVNNDKVYTWANQAGREFFGEDVVGKEAAFYFVGEQETYQQVWPLFTGTEDTVYVESWQRRKDGQARLLAWWCRTLRNSRGQVIGALSSARDITEQKRAADLIRTRLELLDYATSHTPEEILQQTLDQLGELTNSPIGFYHCIESDQKTLSLQVWSTRTRQAFCRVAGKGLHAPIDQAGVWADCIHTQKPVIHNAYANLPHRKGMPEGHGLLVRELVVPILRAGKIVAVVGIGNKPTDYTDADVELVTYLADVAWEIVERKRQETELATRLDELRRWYKLTLGREMRILKLKREVNELLRRLGEPIRYPSATLQEDYQEPADVADEPR